FGAALGEAAVVDHGATDAALGGGDEGVEHEPMTEAENRYIRRFRRVGDARVAFTAEHAWVVRVDRKDSAGKADAVERDDQQPVETALAAIAVHLQELGAEPQPRERRPAAGQGEGAAMLVRPGPAARVAQLRRE